MQKSIPRNFVFMTIRKNVYQRKLMLSLGVRNIFTHENFYQCSRILLKCSEKALRNKNHCSNMHFSMQMSISIFRLGIYIFSVKSFKCSYHIIAKKVVSFILRGEGSKKGDTRTICKTEMLSISIRRDRHNSKKC